MILVQAKRSLTMFICQTQIRLVQIALRLQEKISNGQLYKQAGNSVAVPVIKRIADCIIKAIDTSDLQKAVNNQKYVLLKYKLNNKYDGSCYLADTNSDKGKLVKPDTVNERDYFKLIKRNKPCEFSIIERN